MQTISSNHNSLDQQAEDAMSYLEYNRPAAWGAIVDQFPEYLGASFGSLSSWWDTDAMGVDPEWGSWLVDAIEATGLVSWEDGEPWTTEED